MRFRTTVELGGKTATGIEEHVRALESAKKPETRERRLAKTLEMLRA